MSPQLTIAYLLASVATATDFVRVDYFNSSSCGSESSLHSTFFAEGVCQLWGATSSCKYFASGENVCYSTADCSGAVLSSANVPYNVCTQDTGSSYTRYYKLVATQAAGAEDIRSWSVTVTQHTDASCSTVPMRYSFSKPNGQCVFCLDSGCGGTIENMTCGTGSNLVEIDTGCDGNLRQVTSPMEGGYANAWKCQNTSFGNSYSVVTLCKNHEYLVNATSGITTSGLASFGDIDTPWTKASSSDSSDDDNTGLIVGVVIGGAVLLGVVAFVCMKIAKKKDPVGATMSL